MRTANSIVFFLILFCQGIQVLEGSIIKTNVTNASSQLVKSHNWTKTVDILSTYK